MNSAAILCRGSSANRLSEFTSEVDVCLLVNSWEKDIHREPFNRYVQDKRLIHYVCRTRQSVLSQKTYNKYKFSHVQLNITSKSEDRGESEVCLKKMGIKYQYMEEDMCKWSIDGKGGFPTTGILTVVHAVKCLRIPELYIFGLDFYEAEYFTDNTLHKSKKVLHHQVEKGKVAKRFFLKFCEDSKECKFYMFSMADLPNNLDNMILM